MQRVRNDLSRLSLLTAYAIVNIAHISNYVSLSPTEKFKTNLHN